MSVEASGPTRGGSNRPGFRGSFSFENMDHREDVVDARRHLQPRATARFEIGTVQLVPNMPSPVDRAPHSVPFIGFVDDLTVVPLVIRVLMQWPRRLVHPAALRRIVRAALQAGVTR